MLNLVLIGGLIVTLVTAVPVFLQLRQHPKGLIVCFFTEMWERFSYYGMRGLLIFYLTKQFLFTDAHAGQQYASYTTLIYLVPLVGGLVADRWLGPRRAVIFGGLLLVLGHCGMAFEGQPAIQTLTYHGQIYEFVRADKGEQKLKLGDALYAVHSDGQEGLVIDGLPPNAPLPAALPKGAYESGVKTVTSWAESAFYLSVSLIIMGVGFLKANISTIVGQLYGERDPRRDSGFQLYYFGINLGSFWAAIACGYLGQTFGWGYGFGAAGIGMLAGLLIFVLGKSWLMGKGEAPDPVALKTKVGSLISREHLIYALGAAGVFVVYFLVQKNEIVFLLLTAASLAMLAYIGYNMFTRFNRVENLRIALAIILSIASIVFFTLEELAGSALNLFTDRNVNLDIVPAAVRFDLFGHPWILASRDQLAAIGGLPQQGVWVDMGITSTQAGNYFNAGFILIFAPLFAALFTFLGRRKADPDPVKKFAFGIVSTGFSFLTLVWAAPLANKAFQIPLIFLVLNYLFTTIGELSLSPVGMSQQTKLSPALIVSTMMALWFTGLSWAQFLGGKITEMTATFTINGQVVDPAASLHTSLSVFNMIGWLTVVFGVGLFGLSYLIKGWAGGVNDSEA
ncbi:MAG TPA: MFS transporter [Asticcacaulis sp.]|nr:MFS transporter [Asticcacaulis sp.]